FVRSTRARARPCRESAARTRRGAGAAALTPPGPGGSDCSAAGRSPPLGVELGLDVAGMITGAVRAQAHRTVLGPLGAPHPGRPLRAGCPPAPGAAWPVVLVGRHGVLRTGSVRRTRAGTPPGPR